MSWELEEGAESSWKRDDEYKGSEQKYIEVNREAFVPGV